jgi:hypothetical protein
MELFEIDVAPFIELTKLNEGIVIPSRIVVG